jgi:hypothetical protein
MIQSPRPPFGRSGSVTMRCDQAALVEHFDPEPVLGAVNGQHDGAVAVQEAVVRVRGRRWWRAGLPRVPPG